MDYFLGIDVQAQYPDQYRACKTMDETLESFLKFRIGRLHDISLEICKEPGKNLIPKICSAVIDFCVNRPDTPFFQKAEGTKLIRKDLKYFFPAAMGFDIRPYTSGSHLAFNRDKYLAQAETLQERAALLKSLSRLLILAITYDLLTVDIEGVLDVAEEIVTKARLQNARFLGLFADYLAHVLDVPPHARKLHLSRGNIRHRLQSRLTRDNHATALSWIESGAIPLDIHRLDGLFESVCHDPALSLPEQAVALDSNSRINISLPKLMRHPVSDRLLLSAIRHRYHLTSYLHAAVYYRQPRQKRESLFRKVARTLEGLQELEKEQIADLADFLIGDRSRRLHQKVGFHFDPLPRNSTINWQEWERASVFRGRKPKNRRKSPEHLKLPTAITGKPLRPVCIMLDVSASMADCLDIAMKSLSFLFTKLKGHPIGLVLFSSCAGVLNRGIPIVSRGLPLSQEIPWLPKIVETTRRGLFLGGTTSIGNGILLGKAVAEGIARRMQSYGRWQATNAVTSHCILISDNLHNTPRDITRVDPAGHYIVDSPDNVVDYAVRSGCSIHNLICCSPTNGIDRIIYQLQVIRYIESLVSDYFKLDSPGMPTAKAIEKDLVLTVLSHKPKTILFQYRRDEDSFSLVNAWTRSPVQDQMMQTLAGFVVFLRRKLKQNQATFDAVDFIGRDFGMSPHQFMLDSINMDKVYQIYQLVHKDSEVVLADLDLSLIDANPLQIFKISHCITESQRRVIPFATTPVILKMTDELDRRKSYDNELYFGLKNLERLDSGAEVIAEQIRAMS